MKTINIAITSLLLFLTTNAQASPENGGNLHQESCVKCHSTNVYTRNNTRVKDLPGLGKQVRFCKNNLGITWFTEDVDDVVQYLNKNYYKF